MKTNPNDPIKAITNLTWNSETNSLAIDEHNTDSILNFLGLTKREYFAAMALQGIISHYGVEYQKDHSKESVYFADQLIDELNK